MSLQDILQREEGLRLLVYDDATGLPIKPGSVVRGHPTIGFGRALDVQGITAAEAATLLGNDTRLILGTLAGFSWWRGLDAARQDVCSAMAYQMGVHGLLEFGGMIACIVGKDWQGAASRMLDSLWAKQTPGRAGRMAAIMRGAAS